jgi:DNA-binding NarL/FixJ family response regulator
VVYLIADGHTDRSAAKTLNISVNTVATHMRSAYTKLGVQSRVQLTNTLRDPGELDEATPLGPPVNSATRAEIFGF